MKLELKKNIVKKKEKQIPKVKPAWEMIEYHKETLEISILVSIFSR